MISRSSPSEKHEDERNLSLAVAMVLLPARTRTTRPFDPNTGSAKETPKCRNDPPLETPFRSEPLSPLTVGGGERRLVSTEVCCVPGSAPLKETVA